MEPFPVFSMEWFAGLIEFAGGILLALGLFTRAAALIMSGEMAIGYFLFHATHGFFPMLNRGDAAILYCFVFLYLVFAGAGPWSLDALLWKRARLKAEAASSLRGAKRRSNPGSAPPTGLRRRACHRAGHFGPDLLARKDAELRAAIVI